MFKPIRQRDTDTPKKSRAAVISESIKNELGTVQDDYHDFLIRRFLLTTTKITFQMKAL
jgi:hypothetical protein